MIIDSGTEVTLIGGVGWKPMHISTTQTTSVGTALAADGLTSLVNGDFVTKVVTKQGQPVIIGIGGSAWNPDKDQNETLVKPNDLRSQGYDVCDTPKCFGGSQRLVVNDDTIIPFEFDNDSNITSLNIFAPTQDDINSLPIHW